MLGERVRLRPGRPRRYQRVRPLRGHVQQAHARRLRQRPRASWTSPSASAVWHRARRPTALFRENRPHPRARSRRPTWRHHRQLLRPQSTGTSLVASPAPASRSMRWTARRSRPRGIQAGWDLLGEQHRLPACRSTATAPTPGRKRWASASWMVVVLDSDVEMIEWRSAPPRPVVPAPAISQHCRENTRHSAQDRFPPRLLFTAAPRTDDRLHRVQVQEPPRRCAAPASAVRGPVPPTCSSAPPAAAIALRLGRPGSRSVGVDVHQVAARPSRRSRSRVE